MIKSLVATLVVCCVILERTNAWSQQGQPAAFTTRRLFFSTTATTIAGSVTASFLVESANAAVGPLIDELKDSKTKIEVIPELLEQKEWDKVRNILKTPPVNKLWNLGESQNTLSKLAKESGNVDLFELKDELATTIQMCDQLTYDNVFVYYQPGNGKINIKEPVNLAKQAIQQLQRAIDVANE